MTRNTIASLLMAPLFSLSAVAGDGSSLDDQLKNYLHSEYFSLNVLLQSGARFSFRDDNFQGGRTFEATNARISIRGNLDRGFFYRILYNAVSEPGLLDAFAGYKFSDEFSLTFGAMKPDQTLDYHPDPGSTDFIDRTRMTGLLVGSREIGASAHGDSQGTRTGSRGPFLRGNRSIAGGDLRIESNSILFAAEYLRDALETTALPGNGNSMYGSSLIFQVQF